jgi:hypothetical protein
LAADPLGALVDAPTDQNKQCEMATEAYSRRIQVKLSVGSVSTCDTIAFTDLALRPNALAFKKPDIVSDIGDGGGQEQWRS